MQQLVQREWEDTQRGRHRYGDEEGETAVGRIVPRRWQG